MSLDPAAKAVLGFVTLGLFVADVGFLGEVTTALHTATVALALTFSAGHLLKWRRAADRPAYFREHGLHAGIAAVVFPAAVWLIVARALELHEDKVLLLGHSFVQAAVLISLLLEAIRHQTRVMATVVSPGWLLIGSFAVTIGIGAALLRMPRAVEDGRHLSWPDAVFTSTSAVCVTGLVVKNTATFFSPTGQIIILGLIQIGGLGIMTLTYFVATILFEGMSLHDRFLLGEMISEKSMTRVGRTLRFIVFFTLLSEAIAACLIFLVLPTEIPASDRTFHAIFHAISAFCNAGFSTFPNGLAEASLHGNAALQVIVCILIVLGGLGAIVLTDLHRWFLNLYFRVRHGRQRSVRLRVHSRLVLTATAALILGGTALILASEFALHPGETNGGRFLTALFHSITARTAGFNTVDTGAIGPVTIHLIVALMLIGGSPGGTAGGLRTTVFGSAALHLWNSVRDSSGPIILFHRRLAPETGPRALAILVLATAWLSVNFAVLRQLQPDPSISDTRLFFELASAFATAGLSLNLTPELTESARILILVNMFVGRIGLFTVACTLTPTLRRKRISPPEENILLV